MTRIVTGLSAAIAATLAAGPALAATKNIFSGDFYKLSNTDFIVLLAFLVFVGVLVYFKVPGMLLGLLDKRADGIRDELDEARRLRDEAQALLASYERKQKEVQEQADKIVEHAKQEAGDSAEQAKKDIEASIERKLQGARDKIASAEAAALREVRNRAAEVAVAAAAEVIAKQMTKASGSKLIDESIETVDQKLH